MDRLDELVKMAQESVKIMKSIGSIDDIELLEAIIESVEIRISTIKSKK